MALFYPSITSDNRTESFELQVSRGLVPGHRAVSVFGYNADVDTVDETIWPVGGLMPLLSAAAKLKVSSSSANDASGNTGARSITIFGLDGLYNEIQEVVALSGQTVVETVQSFLRVNYAIVTAVGSGGTAAGTIYMGGGTVTAGVPETIYQAITLGNNATVTGHYTVPAGHAAFILAGSISTGQTTGSHQVTGRIITLNSDGVKRTAAMVALASNTANFNFAVPIPIFEKTDIETRAVASSADSSVASFLNMILVKGEDASGFGIPRY